jgi:predicted outer membrane repeat protein
MSKPTISHGAIFLLLTSLLCFGRAQARTWYVKADGGGDAIAIQPAIYLAESGDTILVAAGRYSGIDNRNIDYMEKSLVVRSESGPRVTIVDCTGEGRGFSFYNGETSAAKLEGFAIVNGHVTGGNGGGIDCSSNSSPTISGCILRNNRADGYGGGICCSSGSSPVISNCAVIRNRASYGGGIYCQQNASPQITNCIVVGDSAWSGGGIALIGGQPVLTGCVIVRNKAFFGAGIACSGSSPQTVITRCVVVSNLAVLSGGGINCVNAAPTINGGVPADRNSIYNNQASQGGTNLRTNTPLTNAQYNFWGRVNQTSEDSLSILDGIEIMGGGHPLFPGADHLLRSSHPRSLRRLDHIRDRLARLYAPGCSRWTAGGEVVLPHARIGHGEFFRQSDSGLHPGGAGFIGHHR